MSITPEELKAVNRWLKARLEGDPDPEPPGGPEARALARRLLKQATGPQPAFESSPLSDSAWVSGVAAGLAEAGGIGSGSRVGAFEIERAIGAGGMGAVYLARRVEGGFEQRVALKILAGSKPGAENYRQFQREREVLSRLEHPNIARLIDGGMTEDWRPWFAMEYVDGRPVDRYADECRLSIERRLELFMQVCGALEYAHGQLVLHRDIKPSNILVTDSGRVKLLDFGLGKIEEGLGAAGDNTETQLGSRWLTPEYASPEQVRGDAVNVASEVYQLGLLLYRMLCARPPYTLSDTSPSPMEMVRAVCETEPPRPSEVWHASGGEIAARARNFTLTPERLRKRLRGDLDNIVLTALAKHPRGRYAGVAELSADIRRHLGHRPVRARAATRGYLARKFLRRYRTSVAVAAGLAVVVLGALAAISWQARVAADERDAARAEAERWDVFNDQLLTLFRQTSSEAGQDGLSARELLQGSAERVDSILAGDPAGQARLKAMLGMLHRSLQDFSAAGPLLEAFADGDDGSTPASLRAQVYADLADVRLRLGDPEGALDAVDHALEVLQPLPGEHDRRLSNAYQIRGRILRTLNDWDEAVAAIEHGLELARTEDGTPNRDLASGLNNLAVTLAYAGRTGDAMVRYRESLEMWTALGLEDSHDALNIMGNLAALSYQQGRLDEAEPLFAEVIERRRRHYGPSGALAALHNNYGLLLLVRHRLDDARNHLERALELQRRFAGPTSPDYAFSLRAMGLLELAEARPELAADHFRRAESLFYDAVGPEHLFTAVVGANRAAVLRHTDTEAAVVAFEEAIALLAAAGPAAIPHLADMRCEQAMLYLDRNEPERALASARECRDLRAKHFPDGAWQHVDAEAILAAVEARMETPRARERLGENIAQLAHTYGPGHPRLWWLREQ